MTLAKNINGILVDITYLGITNLGLLHNVPSGAFIDLVTSLSYLLSK